MGEIFLARLEGAAGFEKLFVIKRISHDQHTEVAEGGSNTVIVGHRAAPKSVTLEPTSVDAGPLGTCIRKVVRTGKFPRGDQDRELEVILVRPA